MPIAKLLIWDFDGTLAFRVGGMWSSALQEILASEAPRLHVTARQLRPYLQSGFPWHRPEEPHPEILTAGQWWDALDPIFRRAFEGVGLQAAQAREMAGRVRRVYPDPVRWRLFGDTLPALDQLSQDGWNHAILSNHTPELPQLVEHLGLKAHVASVFCSAQTGYEKPHPSSFQLVLDAFARARRVWMIGDSMAADIEGAQRVGIPAILVRRQHPEGGIWCRGLEELPGVVGRAS